MDNTGIELITAWLQGKDRNWAEGVALYNVYGKSKPMKKVFDRGENARRKAQLVYHMEKCLALAGVILGAKPNITAKPAPTKKAPPKKRAAKKKTTAKKSSKSSSSSKAK